MKKVLALITGLLIATALVGCTGQDTTPVDVDEVEDTTTTVTEIETDVDTDTKVTRKDASEETASTLSTEDNAGLSDLEEYRDIISESTNIDDCNKVENEEKKALCEDEIFNNKAIAELDNTYCNKILDTVFKEKCTKEVENLKVDNVLATGHIPQN